ncbi:prenyltransferase/squalene oxidase repeat-containing protein [Streptomyces sp. NPDC037389]|uniref:prenyltransferase/squalene oxidase repeat-containing protein n=1 Tax=Streptomyces sp. NPDC037389 TaxID=3155369 RepID=UPI00340B116D
MATSFAVLARRGAVALATAAVLGTAAAPAAFADGTSPSPAAPGLYGTGDPKFDGVFRQSLAFLAQNAAGVAPAERAVNWLAGQQCADGGFAGFRADTGAPCDAKAGEFTDATAAAVQGLAAVGGRAQVVTKGLDWLKAHQNADGGWGMGPGNPSDANSTAIAIGAFAAVGQDPAKAAAKGGKTPYDALLSFQIRCQEKKEDQAGAFGYMPQNGELPANDLASAAAATAALGKGFLVPAAKGADRPVKPAACGDGADAAQWNAAEAVAGYLVKKLDAGGDHLKSSMPGAPEGPDTGATADAALALAAGGHLEAARKPLKWLESADSKTAEWAKGNPGRLAKLVLAAHAAGSDPRSFGGTDLVAALNETGPKPEPASSASAEKKDEKKDDGGGFGAWWYVAVFFVASVGIGFLISGRKKKNQP